MSRQGAFAFTAVIWVVVLLVWLIEPRIHIAVPMSATVLFLEYAALSHRGVCGAAFRDGPRPGPSSLPLDRRLRDLSRMLGACIDPGYGSSFDLRAWEWEGRARPHLAGLIVDRLRERRGVDASARPDEARRILGEELWGVVAATALAPRSAEELSTLIERIHEL